MKVDRHGKAKILSIAEIQLLFSEGFQTPRGRALFSICLFTACRLREACTLYTTDAYEPSGNMNIPECFLEAPTSWDGQGTDSSVPVCGLSTPSIGGLLPSTIPLKIAQAFTQ
jgi:integrase/recombinase XerD